MSVMESPLGARLDSTIKLNRLMQDSFGALLTDEQTAEFASDQYELGVSVGAAETLRWLIPLMAEAVDGNPVADERLRVVLMDARLTLGELVGNEEVGS
jgi:hypothetical protein